MPYTAPPHLEPVHRMQVRRLADKLMAAFDHACDQGTFHIAEQLRPHLEARRGDDANDREFCRVDDVSRVVAQ